MIRRLSTFVLALALLVAPVSAALLATQTLHYSTRTALAAASVSSLTTGDVALVSEGGQEGTFTWSAADQSSGVTTQGSQIGETYVAPNSDTDGSSGAWVRVNPTAARTTFTAGGTISGTNVQTALTEVDTEKAPLASPALTGTPTVPTAGGSDDSTIIANTAWVRALTSSLVSGTSNFKASAVVATTTNGTLASDYENGDTVNGVVLATGNRILIKDQSAGAENCLCTVNASGAPTRATDADSGSELVSATIPVIGGTVNPNSLWIQITPATITPGVTALVFTYLPQAGAYSCGTGCTISSNVISADFSDQATAEAGANNVKVMTPLRVAQSEAAFLTANLSDQSTAETGSNNTKVITPLRSEQHFQAAVDRTFDAVSSTLPDKAIGTVGFYADNLGIPYRAAWRFESTNAAQIAAGSIGTYTTLSVQRTTTGQDTAANPTAQYTDFGAVIQSNRGAGAAFLTDAHKGQQIALQVNSFAPRLSDQGAMLWGIRRVFIPGTTEGATSGVEGNMYIVDASGTTGALQFGAGVQLGNFPDPTGSALYVNKGLGVHVTLEDMTTYPGYAALVTDDRGMAGWENVLVGIQQSSTAPFFQITGRGNADGGGAGAVRSGAGAAGFPAYSKIGDIDTGFGFPAANQVGLYTNSTQQVLVTTTNITSPLPLQILSATAVSSGAAATCSGLRMFSATNLGVYFGTGPPSCTANKGSLYLNTTASTTTTRIYINTNGGTTWTNLTTAL